MAVLPPLASETSMGFMHSTRRISDIVPDVLLQLTTLLRKERQLARAEISEKTRQAAIGLLLVAGGGILLIPGFFILLLAGVAALAAYGFATYWAALIVACGVFLLSALLLMIGISRLKAKNMMLHKTAGQLRRDAAMVKRQLRPDDEFDTRA
jgi:Flp pilus assembly protein TadB